MQNEMKVDGNAVAGALAEVFSLEVTAAIGTCGACGQLNPLGRAAVYVNAPGIVVRCPDCDHVLLRLVRAPGRYWLDLSGTRCLEFAGS